MPEPMTAITRKAVPDQLGDGSTDERHADDASEQGRRGPRAPVALTR